MAKFSLGERAKTTRPCVTLDSDKVMHEAGSECVIVGLPGVSQLLPDWYKVEFDGDPCVCYALEWHLEKLTGSWDEIERLTGWRPGKSKQRKPEAVHE